MILRPEQILLLRLGRPVVPCNFGGGDSSTSSTSSNTTTNVDKRQVVDSGVGVTSDSSTVNVSTQTLDGGAIAGAFDFSKAVVTEYLKPSLDILKSQQAFVSASGEEVAKAYDNAKGEGTQKFMLAVAAGAMVAVVAVHAFKGK